EPAASLHLPVSAFTSYLSQMQGQLYGFARGLLGDDEQAYDVVQDVFVDAWRAAQQGAPPFSRNDDAEAVRRWLFHVAFRRAVSVVRRRKILAFFSLDEGQGAVAAAEVYYEALPFEDRIAEGEALRAALERLGPQDAACLLLNVVQGYTSAEIARILEITPEAAKKR